MLTVPVNQAKDKFSSLLQAVEAGEDVVITRHGKQVAKLVKATLQREEPSAIEQKRQAAMARLEALHASISPSPRSTKSSWKELRDMGRKY